MAGLPGDVIATDRIAACDDCETVAPLMRVQGETDSFGAEYSYVCDPCREKIREQLRAYYDTPHPCDWCGTPDKLLPTRDFDEGTDGPVYEVCGGCRTRQFKAIQDELYGSEDDDPFFSEPYDDDEGWPYGVADEPEPELEEVPF